LDAYRDKRIGELSEGQATESYYCKKLL
jgi:hypothetical protein